MIKKGEEIDRNLIIVETIPSIIFPFDKVFFLFLLPYNIAPLFIRFIQIHKEVAHRQVDNRFIVVPSYQ